MRKTSVIVGALALTTLSVSAAQATTPLSAYLGIGTEASVDQVFQGNGDSENPTAFNSATYSVTSSSTVNFGGGTSTASASVTAFWLNADSGNVDLSWGWNLDSELPSSAATNTILPNWSYTFVASNNGRFFGTYAVQGAGATFGLQQLYGADGLSSVVFDGNIFDPTASGAFSVDLVGGQTYTMSIQNFGNVAYSGPASGVNAQATADLDWSIAYNAIPEPSTWALMIGGFGLAGAALRRRRAVPA